MNKVVLALIDGMTPEGFLNSGNPFSEFILKNSLYALNAKTVFPSVTLPCHFSLFHSVPPERHGITTNIYTPQVRPIEGLFERLRSADKKSAFFYSWHELKDLFKAGSLSYSCFLNTYQNKDVDRKLTDAAIEYLIGEKPDMLFLYLGETDSTGHSCGWMSDEYLKCISKALSCVKDIYSNMSDDYSLILTADHGGHGRMHGENVPSDMTIPVFFMGREFKCGRLNDVSIMDIAPTITKLMGLSPAFDWEGRSIL